MYVYAVIIIDNFLYVITHEVHTCIYYCTAITCTYLHYSNPVSIFFFLRRQCFKIVAGYLVIMAIVVTAFAVLGYCAFGSQVYYYTYYINYVIRKRKIIIGLFFVNEMHVLNLIRIEKFALESTRSALYFKLYNYKV